MDISLSRLDNIETNGWPKDPFFGPTSKLLLQGVKALAAGSQYPDLLTCLVMLVTKNLARRVEIAELDGLIKGHFSSSLNSSFSDSIREAIQNTAIDKLRRLLPARIEREEMELRRAELERILPFDESALNDSTTSESSDVFQIFQKGNIAQFDSAEAAEHAAWMLRGECVNQTQVIVPLHNANSYALDAIAALVGSRWAWIEASDESA
jgi:hypothetical protein